VLFSGYFNQPEATLRAFRNLWYHTGTSAGSTATASSSSSTERPTFMRYKGRNVSSSRRSGRRWPTRRCGRWRRTHPVEEIDFETR